MLFDLLLFISYDDVPESLSWLKVPNSEQLQETCICSTLGFVVNKYDSNIAMARVDDIVKQSCRLIFKNQVNKNQFSIRALPPVSLHSAHMNQ